MDNTKYVNFIDSINNTSKKQKQYNKKQQEQDISLNMVYTDDLNISKLAILVTDKIKQTYNNILSEINDYKNKLDKITSIIEIKYINKEIEILTKQLENYNDNKVEEYLNRINDVVKKYNDFRPLQKIYSFANDVLDECDDNYIERQKIISEFLNISREYIEINITKIIRFTTTNCPFCETDFVNNPYMSFNSTNCSKCGSDISMYIKNDYYKDYNRTNVTNRNNYEDRENFIKALKRFQGKQQNKLPDKLFEDLTKYFKSYGFPTPDEIKNMPLNPNGTRGNFSRDLIYKALSETGNSDYYEDINLITHILWNWELPDLSDIEDLIIQDYDKTQEIYEKIKSTVSFQGKINRKSSINIQYRLMRHLLHRGYKCSTSDFKIAKTDQIIEYYENLWSLICKEIGWEMKSINEL